MKNLTNYINHSRNFDYMSGIDRDRERQKATAEVFTPTEYVQEILDDEEKKSPDMFRDWTKTYMDNSCGDGQILSEVVIRKMERSNCTLEQALSTTYGVELMEDNVKLCKERLAGPNPTMKIYKILNKNIVCADALTYDYGFGEPVGLEKWLEKWRALKQVVTVMVVENFFSKINVPF
jgi:hypothetical protein